MVTKKQDYNNVPVHYCKTCLSLAVKEIKLSSILADPGVEYCSACSNDDIGIAHIEEWTDMYEKRYKKNYLTGEKIDGRDS